MEEKIVLPAGISMGGTDESWSDISIYQSEMQEHTTIYVLKPCVKTVYVITAFLPSEM